MYNVFARVDCLGTKCQSCKKGTYIEKTLQDSWSGIITCDKCHNSQKRYLELRMPRMPEGK